MDFPRFYFLLTRRQLFMSSLANLTNDPWEGLPPSYFFDPKRPVVVTSDPSAFIRNPELIKTAKAVANEDAWGVDFATYVKSGVAGFRALKKRICVSCWHMNEVESEALWRIYGGRGFGICVRSTYERLGAALTYPRLYGGTVAYLDETKEMLGGNNIFDNCIWKRRSFAHEREFRVVTMAGLGGTNGIEVPVDIDVLAEEIIVHPEAEPWFLKVVEDLVASVGCKARVHRSQLLTEPEYKPTEGCS